MHCTSKNLHDIESDQPIFEIANWSPTERYQLTTLGCAQLFPATGIRDICLLLPAENFLVLHYLDAEHDAKWFKVGSSGVRKSSSIRCHSLLA
jgi:hypothetical protein